MEEVNQAKWKGKGLHTKPPKTTILTSYSQCHVAGIACWAATEPVQQTKQARPFNVIYSQTRASPLALKATGGFCLRYRLCVLLLRLWIQQAEASPQNQHCYSSDCSCLTRRAIIMHMTSTTVKPLSLRGPILLQFLTELGRLGVS